MSSTRVSSARLIGRTAELATLEAALADARAGRPSLAFVAGESGVGKTRLVGAFAATVAAAGVPVLRGECVALGEGELPYAPIAGALRPLARRGHPVLATLPADVRRPLAALVPGLDVLSPDGPPGAGGPSGDGDRAVLFEALLALLDALARDDGLVLVVEDAHWADASTRAFLSFLARGVVDERLLVVATYRPDELHRRHPLRPLLAELEGRAGSRRIDLPRLTRDELGDLLADVLGAPADVGLVDRLWTRGEGNPLFTEELLAAGLDGRGGLPPTVSGALRLRIERLSPAAQEVARVVAIGRAVDHAVLATAVGLPEREIHAALRGDSSTAPRPAARSATPAATGSPSARWTSFRRAT
ncbi:AAA family ATPase, partial [Patulibacter sp. NPDC049589]|uniref:ATP-binding protein n=1 Tax=Patulibacter sp. NPDC049589 TaxID=3154731 RepID=UPI00343A543B